MVLVRSRALLVSVLFALSVLLVVEPFGIVPSLLRSSAALVATGLLGYAVGLTLIPDGLSVGGRLAVTLGAAMAVPVAAAFLLTVTPWGIGGWEFLAVFVVAFIGAVALGWRRSPEAWRRPWSLPTMDRRAAMGGALYVLAAAGAVAAVGIRADVVSQPVAGSTALSLDPTALAGGRVEAHVVSDEDAPAQFRLDFAVDGSTTLTRTAALRDGEEWVVTMPDATAGDRVTVTLYRLPDAETPYRTVVATVPRPGASASPSGGD